MTTENLVFEVLEISKGTLGKAYLGTLFCTANLAQTYSQ